MKKDPAGQRNRFAKKSLGQNFLADENIVRKIVDAAHVTMEDVVIEIGPGRGALTRELAKRASDVIAIELDRDMVEVLEREFGRGGTVRVLNRDVLKTDLAGLIEPGKKAKVMANLPYNISTAVLQQLIDSRKYFSDMVLMLQREVVDRITAKAGNSERGYLSVITQAFLEVEKLFEVPPTAFRPVPEVWSAVIRAVPRESNPEIAGMEKSFEKLVSIGFRQKRKTILNNLKSASDRGSADLAAVLAASGIDPVRRAETLTVDEWVNLFTAYGV
jgi:16S rRNA (adenine1518-N6/adenine1519-N6)-dimethyltransferase